MQLTAEWVGAIATALATGILIGSGFQRRRDARRNALPIMRAIWKDGQLGFTVTVELENRLNEDLHVTKAECRSRFGEVIPGDYDPETGNVEVTYHKKASPMNLDFRIPPNGKSLRDFKVDGPETSRWLRLTMSSSAKTLRSRRMVVRDGNPYGA